jgi:hypothetical protein
MGQITGTRWRWVPAHRPAHYPPHRSGGGHVSADWVQAADGEWIARQEGGTIILTPRADADSHAVLAQPRDIERVAD